MPRVRVADDKVRQVSFPGKSFGRQLENMVSDLNICSKKGLSERFDSTIGAGTVMMPFGGAHQLTPSQTMVAKIPVLHGTTNTVTGHGLGFPSPGDGAESPTRARTWP